MLKFLRFDLGIDSVQTHPRENSENMCLFNEVGYIWVKFCIVVNELFLNLEVINIFYLQRNSLQLILTLRRSGTTLYCVIMKIRNYCIICCNLWFNLHIITVNRHIITSKDCPFGWSNHLHWHEFTILFCSWTPQ